MLTEDLKSIGLTEQEATVYLAGLELGPSSIMQLAKKVGVNRTSLYHTMAGLTQKKLFVESAQGKKRVFVAEGAIALKALVQSKLAHVDIIAEGLKALARTSTVKPIIKFYEGVNGIKTIFRYLANAKEKKSYAFVGVESLNSQSKTMLDFWLNEFTALRKKYNNTAYLIMPDSEGGKLYKATDQEKLRETRLLPSSSFNFPAEVMITDDIISMFVFTTKEQFAISVESPAIAETLKMVFKLCWKQAL